jgi:uncharacterized protein
MNRRDFLSQSALSALALPPWARAQASGGAPRRDPVARQGPDAPKLQGPREQSIFDSVRSGRGLEGVDAIDTHAHFQEMPKGVIWPLNVETLMADSHRCGIRQTIVSPFAGYNATNGEQLRAAHDACVEAVAKYPTSLRAYLVFQPHLRKASEAEMPRVLQAESPFVGFKLHGAIDHYPTTGPNYQPLFEFANEHGLTVLLHQSEEELKPVASVIQKYPRLNLILAHIALLPDNLGSYLKANPNLFADTCGSTLPYRRLEQLVHEVGAEKILFGTDATYLAVGSQVAKVAFANISEEEKRLVFGGNARRLFGSRLAPL